MPDPIHSTPNERRAFEKAADDIRNSNDVDQLLKYLEVTLPVVLASASEDQLVSATAQLKAP